MRSMETTQTAAKEMLRKKGNTMQSNTQNVKHSVLIYSVPMLPMLPYAALCCPRDSRYMQDSRIWSHAELADRT